MSQRFQSWQAGRGSRGERLWLSALVDAMERAAHPSQSAQPCDSRTLVAFRAQLALPAQPSFASRTNLLH